MHEPLRVLIVDDEPLSRERIGGLLARSDGVELVGECADGVEALGAIEADAPDVVFLDVRMPRLDGLGVVEAIEPRRCPQIVFVTAYDLYMERAFEVHALDYLRKPFTDARFFAALEHARRRVEERRGFEEARATVLSILSTIREADGGRRPERLVIQEVARGPFRVVRTREIECVRAHEKQVRVHVGKDAFVWRVTLTQAERTLDPATFLRVHRSIIVNSARIRMAEPLWKGEYVLRLESGRAVETGRSYRAAVERFLRDAGR
jgi:two-component system LytT family response regulator